MVHLFNSLLQKLKLKPRLPFPPVAPRKSARSRAGSEVSPSAQEAHLLSLHLWNDAQLGEYVAKQSERDIIKLLQTLNSERDGERSSPSQPLQVRIVQHLTDESTLKRIARSEFSKKVKRTAEKRLRETGSGAA